MKESTMAVITVALFTAALAGIAYFTYLVMSYPITPKEPRLVPVTQQPLEHTTCAYIDNKLQGCVRWTETPR